VRDAERIMGSRIDSKSRVAALTNLLKKGRSSDVMSSTGGLLV
jgi:hypothetical protein